MIQTHIESSNFQNEGFLKESDVKKGKAEINY